MRKPIIRPLVGNMLLAFLVFLVLTSSGVHKGFSQSTQLRIIAPATVPLLTEFNVDISVVDVTDLFSWQVKLYYNPTVLTWINATLPPGHVFDGKQFSPMPAFTGTDVGGTYILFTASLFGDEPRFYGNGTLCRMSFEAKAKGTSALTFSRPLGGDTYLWNYDLNDISAMLVDDSVDVMGGLTLTIISPLDGSEVRSSTVTVTWTATDESSTIHHNEIRLDGGSWVDVGTNMAETFTGLGDGTHTVDVKAFSEVGMSIQKSVSFTVNAGILFGLGYFEVVVIFAIIIIVAVGITLYLLRIRKKR